ncbi:MAG TPA: c-type cytochrome [Anaerolineales bacterium]|nr:c-type cytochrome [Anaerolineales bacterium]
MKFRYMLSMALLSILLGGCSLASDITPPPNYVSPTPLPTLGALYPASAPNIQNGAALFAQNCAPCHGDSGLGNGPQSQQLPVTVPALGLSDIARSASPAQWFTTVSQGNLDRFMPPFSGTLSDQDRWDVISYVLTLHTKPDQIAQGKTLFDANCPNCASEFTDLKTMAALSEDDIIGIIQKGQGDIPAFGAHFSPDQALDVAMYIRSLTFAATPSTPAMTASTLATTAPAGTGTAAAAPSASTPEATSGAAATTAPASPNAAGTGTVSGTVQFNGGPLPAGLTVTLHGYDHPQDQNSTATPAEVVTLTSPAAPDGSFRFPDVPMPVNRLFTAEVDYQDVQYESDPAAVTAGMTSLVLSPVKLYDTTPDFSTLTFNQIHLYFDFATQGQAQVYEIYAFTNATDKTVIISTDGATVPFIKIPDGAQNVNYQADQNSSTFVGAGTNGVAAPPNSKAYAIIATFNMPYDNKQLEIRQPIAVDSPSMVLLLPDGMKASGGQLTDNGLQTVQNNSFETYSESDLSAGDVLDFTITGTPKNTTAPSGNSPALLFIGAGALGLMLIGAGVWFFLRDQKSTAEEEEEQDEFDSADEVMDAILALDDLHRAGQIKDDAYQKRRAELKEILKEMA